ncbi:MAG: alpha/beta hydrolase [Victivallales bacterium]|jgi:hypothetical protein
MMEAAKRIALTGLWSIHRAPWGENSAFREIGLKAKDGLHVSGWTGCSENGVSSSRGTIISGNGFMTHSRQCGSEEWAWMFRSWGYNVVSIDFRNHGNSGARGVPTFGLPESWDMEAGLAFASENYPGPYMLFGPSMAGMAAQLLAQRDGRVSGAVLTITPASPRIAMKNSIPGRIPGIGFIGGRAWGKIVKCTYGEDMISRGDILKGDMHPLHEPDLLFISGGRDMFGECETRRVFDSWYPYAPGYNGGVRENWHDLSGPGCKKFYLLYPEGGHGENMPWGEIHGIVMRFFERVVARRRNYDEFFSSASSGNFTCISNLMNNKTLDEIKYGQGQGTALLRPIPLLDGFRMSILGKGLESIRERCITEPG